MDNKKNILYVLHAGTSGGTFDTTIDLIKNLGENFNIYILGAENDYLVLYKFLDGQLNVLTKFLRNRKWSAKIFHDSWLTYIYYEVLIDYNINLVHIMHLINHSFDLPQIAKKLKIPVILSFHDYYFVCPNFILLNENNEYCEGKCSNNNINCNLNWDLFEDIHFKTILPAWRKNASELFDNVDIFISSSNFVKNLFLSVYNNQSSISDENFIIIEHGRDFRELNQKLYAAPSKDKQLKIVFPANQLNEIKGTDIIKKIKKLDKNNDFEFHFLGNVPEEMNDYGINHGPYVRDEFYKCIEKIKPSFIGIFSICPETYCHTITESWSCGVPVIGTNIGVIKYRIVENNGGIIIDKDDINQTFETLLKLKEISSQNYENLVNDVSKIYLKTTKEMAVSYLEIYNNLLNFN